MVSKGRNVSKKNGKVTRITPVPGMVALPQQDDPLNDPTDAPNNTVTNDLEQTVDQTTPDELNRVLLELGEDASESKVQIWRINKDNPRQPIYVYEMLPSEFSLQRLSDEYGGGTYMIRVYAPAYDDAGHKLGSRIVKAPRIFIDGAPKLRKVVEESTANAPAGLEIIAKAIADSNAAVIAAINARPAEKSMAAQFTELATLQKLLKGDEPKSQDPFSLVERVLKLQESVRESMPAGGGGELGSLLGLGREIIRGVKALPPAPASAGATNRDLGIAVDSPSASNNSQPAGDVADIDDEGEAMNLIYFAQITRLCSLAKSNAPAIDVARSVYEDFGEQLRPLITAPNWIELLASYNAAVKRYAPWFQELHAELTKLDSAARKANPIPPDAGAPAA